MDCIKCRCLTQAFEYRLNEYIEALASSYYRVSTKLAAHKNIDMERSRNDLEEHQLVCVSVVPGRAAFGAHSRRFAVVEEKKAATAAG
jgi:hypothetical protein